MIRRRQVAGAKGTVVAYSFSNKAVGDPGSREHLHFQPRPVTRLLLLCSFLLGCAKEPVAVPPTQHTPGLSATLPSSPPANRPVEDDCTLATPLVPGIPGSPGHLIKSARNPNGDSELAVLMRKFVADLHDARTLLEAGKPVAPWFATHRKMRCSWPTVATERNERFDGLAQGYLAMVKAFDAVPTKTTYNNVIRGCISCHAASCGGPLEFIEGMIWN